MGSTPDPTGKKDLIDDGERLREIERLRLTSPDADDILAGITREAALRLGLPISLISIVLDESQFFAAEHGLSGWLKATRGTPIASSFCVNAMRTGSTFVVTDASVHPVVKENPLVLEDGIRCYAGIPLVTSRGHTLGTLCVLGTESHDFTPADLKVLEELAARAMQRIESRAAA